jgi:hypothetical protein
MSSPSFTFFVAEEMEPVLVHGRAFAALSLPLDRLINGNMKEAEDRVAELPDMEKEDFMRLCEFAYRGDYTIPMMVRYENSYKEDDEKETDKEMEAATVAELERMDLERQTRETIHEEDRQREEAREEWKRDVKDMTAIVRLYTRYQNRNNNPRPEPIGELSILPILLAHARLYCIADRYCISSLQDYTMNRLYDIIIDEFRFEPLPTERARDIVEFAEFAYSTDNTRDHDDYSNLDELRQLVIDIIVHNIDVMEKSAEFKNMLEEGGQFVSDLWHFERQDRKLTEDWNKKSVKNGEYSKRFAGGGHHPWE